MAWPNSSQPQQATEPLFLTPQVWIAPALTETKVPAGGVAWPAPLSPQQATEPLPLTPQVCPPPALTETKGLTGTGVGVGVSVGVGVGVGWGVAVGYGVFVVGVGSGVGIGVGVGVGVVPELGRRGLTGFIAAPAGDGAVAPQPAGVVPPGADGDEGTYGRRGRRGESPRQSAQSAQELAWKSPHPSRSRPVGVPIPVRSKAAPVTPSENFQVSPTASSGTST